MSASWVLGSLTVSIRDNVRSLLPFWSWQTTQQGWQAHMCGRSLLQARLPCACAPSLPFIVLRLNRDPHRGFSTRVQPYSKASTCFIPEIGLSQPTLSFVKNSTSGFKRVSWRAKSSTVPTLMNAKSGVPLEILYIKVPQ